MDLQFYPARTVPRAEANKAHDVWHVGKFRFRADFDSANLHYVKQGSSSSDVQLWTRKDCQGTACERGTRSWFHFGVSGQNSGDWVALNIMNINKQGKLFGQDYRPWYWSASMAEWQPISVKVIYKRDHEDFQLRFSFKFDSADEVFFAFAIPFGYRENQALLDHITHMHCGLLTAEPDGSCGPSSTKGSPTVASKKAPTGSTAGSSPNNPTSSRIYFKRQLLARSVEGRDVDLITITDCYGASSECESMPPALHRSAWEDNRLSSMETLEGSLGASQDSGPCGSGNEGGWHSNSPVPLFPSKKVFFISARVHPGETPASHLFNGILTFLLRQHDARAAALRRLFVFKLVPIINPDGVYHGHYRTDTLGQNLNRFYLGQPSQELQPCIWAIKSQLSQYSQRGVLEYYLDLHAHANKKGVFVYGNALEGEQAVESLLYSKLVALNSPIFDFVGCNFTEKNMSRPDKDGASKEGAGRVALFRETGLTHLYTIEANYNSARVLNLVPPASGKHNGRASPPNTRRISPRFTADVLQAGGRAFLVAALDMYSANPWSRLASSEFHNLQGLRSWVMTCLRAPADTRLQHLPPMSDSVELAEPGSASRQISGGGPSWSIASTNSSDTRVFSGSSVNKCLASAGGVGWLAGTGSSRGGRQSWGAGGVPSIANARRIVSFGRTQAVLDTDMPGLSQGGGRSLGGGASRSTGRSSSRGFGTSRQKVDRDKDAGAGHGVGGSRGSNVDAVSGQGSKDGNAREEGRHEQQGGGSTRSSGRSGGASRLGSGNTVRGVQHAPGCSDGTGSWRSKGQQQDHRGADRQKWQQQQLLGSEQNNVGHEEGQQRHTSSTSSSAGEYSGGEQEQGGSRDEYGRSSLHRVDASSARQGGRINNMQGDGSNGRSRRIDTADAPQQGVLSSDPDCCLSPTTGSTAHGAVHAAQRSSDGAHAPCTPQGCNRVSAPTRLYGLSGIPTYMQHSRALHEASRVGPAGPGLDSCSSLQHHHPGNESVVGGSKSQSTLSPEAGAQAYPFIRRQIPKHGIPVFPRSMSLPGKAALHAAAQVGHGNQHPSQPPPSPYQAQQPGPPHSQHQQVQQGDVLSQQQQNQPGRLRQAPLGFGDGRGSLAPLHVHVEEDKLGLSIDGRSFQEAELLKLQVEGSKSDKASSFASLPRVADPGRGESQLPSPFHTSDGQVSSRKHTGRSTLGQ